MNELLLMLINTVVEIELAIAIQDRIAVVSKTYVICPCGLQP